MCRVEESGGESRPWFLFAGGARVSRARFWKCVSGEPPLSGADGGCFFGSDLLFAVLRRPEIDRLTYTYSCSEMTLIDSLYRLFYWKVVT